MNITEQKQVAINAVFDQMRAFILNPPPSPAECDRIASDLGRRFVEVMGL